MRVLPKLLLSGILAACGAPGSDAVFTQGNPKATRADSILTPKPDLDASRRPATRAIAGYFRRVGDDLQFQPCGTRLPLEITGTGPGRLAVKERARWMNVWEGVKMYGVFQGAIVTDTPSARGVDGDTTRRAPRTRFFVVSVDSLRSWFDGDCGGMRLP